MDQKHRIRLKKKERHPLEKVVQSGKHNARQITRCRILLLADCNTKGKRDREIVEALGVCLATVHNVPWTPNIPWSVSTKGPVSS